MDQTTPTPEPTIDASFALPNERPPGGDEITGILGADAVEGGCTYLQAADGVRYEVIYPDGWQIQASPLQLTNPAGEVVATGGESIIVRGRMADDMASICQVGPIFMASEVAPVD